jgi:hypothetical protein
MMHHKCKILCKKLSSCKILDPLVCGEKFKIRANVRKAKDKKNPFKKFSFKMLDRKVDW